MESQNSTKQDDPYTNAIFLCYYILNVSCRQIQIYMCSVWPVSYPKTTERNNPTVTCV